MSFDIKLAIEEIELFISEHGKNYDQYSQNTLLKRAIERDLEIIGEAMNRILKEEPDFQINNAYRIVGLRNQIIHGYDLISDENIWAVIVKHIPQLKTEIIEKMN